MFPGFLLLDRGHTEGCQGSQVSPCPHTFPNMVVVSSLVLGCPRVFILFLKILFIFREGKGGREEEKHQCVVASCVPHTGDLA